MCYLRNLPPFQHFGSMDSEDMDIVFFVDILPPTIADCAAKCADLSVRYATLFSAEKKVNANLAVVENEVVVDVFKGNVDEVNNALFSTYHLHSQYYPSQIKRFLPRDLGLKCLRVARSILSLLTKTAEREAIKNALRGDICLKMSVLHTIDLRYIDWPNSKMPIVDIKKMLAFQIGQSLALFEGKEVYTKSDIGAIYPALKPYLNRELNTNFTDLQSYLVRFNAAVSGLENVECQDFKSQSIVDCNLKSYNLTSFN